MNINFKKKSFITIFIAVFYEIFLKFRCIFNLFKTIYWQLLCNYYSSMQKILEIWWFFIFIIIFLYLLLAFTYWWITWNIPPLIPFSIINNKSKSVNCSYFTFKAAFHANCGTAKNQAGSSSYNSRNIFRKFSNKSASTSVLPLINKSWYSPNLSISKSCMQSASVLSSMFRKRSFNKFFPIIHIIVWLRPFRNSEISSLVVWLQNLYVLGNHFIKLYLVIILINKHLYTTKSLFYLFIQGNTIFVTDSTTFALFYYLYIILYLHLTYI